MPTRPRQNVLFTVIVAALSAVGALAMVVVIALSGAPGSLAVASILAAVPVAPLVACYLWLDRYEPEPKLLLVAGLIWGGFVATAATLVIQGVGGLFVPISDSASLAVVAPITEELCKGLFLVLLLVFRRHELDGVLDGIVYAGMVGIGFAFIENILYLAAAYNGTDGVSPGGTEAVGALFVLRCLASPFAHPLYTAFTGIGIGIAVGSRSRVVQVLAPIGGYLVAVLAHGLWNGSTLYGSSGFFGTYFLVMVPVFVAMVWLAIYARRSEKRLLVTALTDAAQRGLLPASDIGWLVDLRGRRQARVFARTHGGEAGEQAMRDYQKAAVELGYLHHRFLRGTPPDDYSDRGNHYVTEIRAIRPSVAFPGQVVPVR